MAFIDINAIPDLGLVFAISGYDIVRLEIFRRVNYCPIYVVCYTILPFIFSGRHAIVSDGHLGLCHLKEAKLDEEGDID